ncbi:hypothetical protein P9711_17770, partial [Anoxybacillus geothermalis]|nr:hypothetical protein [Anoxybacillus geothermalis]
LTGMLLFYQILFMIFVHDITSFIFGCYLLPHFTPDAASPTLLPIIPFCFYFSPLINFYK